MTFLITLREDEDGGFVARCPAVPEVSGHGATIDEAEYKIFEALYERIDQIVAKGWHPKVVVREIEIPFGIEQGSLDTGEAELMA